MMIKFLAEGIKQKEENKIRIDSIRERVFKEIFSKSLSPDLAAYISDDFAIINGCCKF